ncbi:MAG: heat-inducible transcription repressor HrcA [Parcubacteria group bacterium Gr01-1014_66]|nr:MAG: heat-inducible transcription repressor HrcA [Parcubacteria group bacterium Gr01-1014_66]
MLMKRQKSILDAVIRTHVRTARPVASQDIMHRQRALRVSASTIRNEMVKLDEQGYLEQPHTSAGRVPTDEGYRSYVERIREYAVLDERDQQRIRAIFTSFDEVDTFLREFGIGLSRVTKSFVATGAFEDQAFFDVGFGEILAEPEFHDIRYAEEFGRLVDLLHARREEMMQHLDDESHRVLIGKENPLPEAHRYTMLSASWHHPQGFEGFVTILGPRRMDYRKNIALLHYLEEWR